MDGVRGIFLLAVVANIIGSGLGAPSFEWGAATAAYQVEGATTEGGRGQSIWDTFAAQGRTSQGQSGAVADDFYHKYPVDVALMKRLGIRNFRMSIAWPRIMPQGTGAPDARGIAFYNNLLNALLEADIEPHVTLYHWDLPQTLQDRYGGWGGASIVDDFAAYAEAVFVAFGDKVHYYTTVNEPWTFCFLGYGSGAHAPGVTGQAWYCVYHVLAAHAAAVKRLRAINPSARVSMNLNVDWAEPLTLSDDDRAASLRFLDFMVGIFADPVYKGDYPQSVRDRVPSSQLIPIHADLAADLKGSMDVFALNHYTSQYVRNSPGAQGDLGQGTVDYSGSNQGNNGPIGPVADSNWLYIVPWGFRNILGYINDRYRPAEIFVTENGVDVPGENGMSMEEALNDQFRVNYFRTYLDNAVKAVESDGVPLTKYFAWSLLDNFEWVDGYGKRFGIVYVDYANNQTRRPKASALWLANFFGTAQPGDPILQAATSAAGPSPGGAPFGADAQPQQQLGGPGALAQAPVPILAAVPAPLPASVPAAVPADAPEGLAASPSPTPLPDTLTPLPPIVRPIPRPE